jgi:predicted MFS family arabinose efflux permease
VLAAYRPLLASREARLLWATSVVGRLAVGLLGVPLVLVAQAATGSYAAAGAVAGAGSVGVAISAPLRGRWIDRVGAARALPPLVVVEASVLALLPVLARTHNGLVLAVASLVLGLAALPLVAAMRLEWQRLLGKRDPRLAHAYALETVTQISVFVAGPALAGAIIASLSAQAALLVAAALTAVGGMGFAARARAAPSPTARRRRVGPLRQPGVRTLVLVTVLADACLGIVEVSVIAAANQEGRASVAGLLLAVFSAASALGGAAYGARTWRASPAARLAVLTALSAVAYPLLAAAGSLPLLAVALAIAGPPSAAQWATTSVALDDVAPAGTDAEAFTWLSSANATGIALGSAAAGALIERAGTDQAFLCGSLVAALACAVVIVRRPTLAARPLAASPAG